jgi:hypothetical protein
MCGRPPRFLSSPADAHVPFGRASKVHGPKGPVHHGPCITARASPPVHHGPCITARASRTVHHGHHGPRITARASRPVHPSNARPSRPQMAAGDARPAGPGALENAQSPERARRLEKALSTRSESPVARAGAISDLCTFRRPFGRLAPAGPSGRLVGPERDPDPSAIRARARRKARPPCVGPEPAPASRPASPSAVAARGLWRAPRRPFSAALLGRPSRPAAVRGGVPEGGPLAAGAFGGPLAAAFVQSQIHRRSRGATHSPDLLWRTDAAELRPLPLSALEGFAHGLSKTSSEVDGADPSKGLPHPGTSIARIP